jgi:hypothetical protein
MANAALAGAKGAKAVCSWSQGSIAGLTLVNK